ncbi:MAG: type II toxin-antitoxin system VapB family antitoxin [Synergistaceae bacterium]|jgi:antitoxin VapB|nr:type II toxin-antitoxin system VapB family antitoxin [Synergistaceae bacterium]
MSRATARIFMSGRSQALRLPKAFHFSTREVYIEKEGEKVILLPKPSVTWDSFFDSGPCPDFELDRSYNKSPQERDLF